MTNERHSSLRDADVLATVLRGADRFDAPARLHDAQRGRELSGLLHMGGLTHELASPGNKPTGTRVEPIRLNLGRLDLSTSPHPSQT